MKCTEAREDLRDLAEDRLDEARARDVRAHLATCAECTRVDEEERVVTELLRTRLPRAGAPEALRARVAGAIEMRNAHADAHAEAEAHARAQAKADADTRERAKPRADADAPANPPRPLRPAKPEARRAGAISLLVAVAASVALFTMRAPRAPDASPLVAESVNDHLRALYAEKPVEIASGGIHQVKPWFNGRLDFAPAVAFGGDDDFPLEGGAVAYFVDRKAAAFFFKRRLHPISLFVFRAENFAMPSAPTEASARGFHVVLWTRGELGYALVSDVDPAELTRLAGKITP